MELTVLAAVFHVYGTPASVTCLVFSNYLSSYVSGGNFLSLSILKDRLAGYGNLPW